MRNNARLFPKIPLLGEELTNYLVKSETGGPMEVSYRETQTATNLDEEPHREYVESIEGGIVTGITRLAHTLNIYKDIEDENLRLRCVFADWMAPEYSSRNAGFQFAISEALQIFNQNQRLALDGNLGPNTRTALLSLFELITKNGGLAPTKSQVDHDLEQSSTANFTKTATWLAIQKILNHEILPRPARTGIISSFIYRFLNAALSGYSNSEEYAELRFKEYSAVKRNLIAANAK